MCGSGTVLGVVHRQMIKRPLQGSHFSIARQDLAGHAGKWQSHPAMLDSAGPYSSFSFPAGDLKPSADLLFPSEVALTRSCLCMACEPQVGHPGNK